MRVARPDAQVAAEFRGTFTHRGDPYPGAPPFGKADAVVTYVDGQALIQVDVHLA